MKNLQPIYDLSQTSIFYFLFGDDKSAGSNFRKFKIYILRKKYEKPTCLFTIYRKLALFSLSYFHLYISLNLR